MTPEPQEPDDSTLIDLGNGVFVDPITKALHFAGKIYPGVRVDVSYVEDEPDDNDA